jgi:hypothetical protein
MDQYSLQGPAGEQEYCCHYQQILHDVLDHFCILQ